MVDLLDTPSSREALAARLDSLGVRTTTYHLFGARLEDAVVLDCRAQGWVVFYSERGGESSLTIHDDEASACADLLARVTSKEDVFFDLVAGPAPTSEADHAFDTWLQKRRSSRESLAPADWKYDDVPWAAGPYWRRYFVKITEIRRLNRTP